MKHKDILKNATKLPLKGRKKAVKLGIQRAVPGLPKPKKIDRKKLRDKADKLFAEKVRSIGRCQLKGLDHVDCTNQLQCMHIVTRSNYRLRWDTFNALCGCSAHHFWYTNNPFEWNELIREKFPLFYKYVKEHKNEKWDKDFEKVFKNL